MMAMIHAYHPITQWLLGLLCIMRSLHVPRQEHMVNQAFD